MSAARFSVTGSDAHKGTMMYLTTTEMATTAFVIEALTLAIVVITAGITACRITATLNRIVNKLDDIPYYLKDLLTRYDDKPAETMVDIK